MAKGTCAPQGIGQRVGLGVLGDQQDVVHVGDAEERLDAVEVGSGLGHEERHLQPGPDALLADPPARCRQGPVPEDVVVPRGHRETRECSTAWRALPWVIDVVLVLVGAVDAQYERAVSCGATILSRPEDTPAGRLCRVEDPEGDR